MEIDISTPLRRSRSSELFERINRAYARADLPKTDCMVGPYSFSREPLGGGQFFRFEKRNSTTWFTADNPGVTAVGSICDMQVGPKYASIRPGSLILGVVHPYRGNELEFNYFWRSEDNIPVLRSLDIIALGENPSLVLYRKSENWVAERPKKRPNSIIEKAPDRLSFNQSIFGVEVPPYLDMDFDKIQACYLERFGLMNFLRHATLEHPKEPPKEHLREPVLV